MNALFLLLSLLGLALALVLLGARVLLGALSLLIKLCTTKWGLIIGLIGLGCYAAATT
ncbi:hypothetical protein OG312_11110 [Kocuria rhizophila]|uniref:hypothetical protein n=1 Tax=Kocuria rhizophila TaxID=72000 RepID=UPI002E0F85E7|nr:hypothetical protein OG312_11110 [Kocuria rhizophila]